MLGSNHPEAVLAWNNLGAVFLDRGEVGRAREYFEKAVAAAGGHLESRYNLALILLGEGETEEAIGHLERAAAVSPNHEQVNVRLGLAYLNSGRGEDAYRSFLLVRRLYPENWVAPLGLAVLHAANEQPEQARQLLEEAFARGGGAAHQLASGYPVLESYLN